MYRVCSVYILYPIQSISTTRITSQKSEGSMPHSPKSLTMSRPLLLHQSPAPLVDKICGLGDPHPLVENFWVATYEITSIWQSRVNGGSQKWLPGRCFSKPWIGFGRPRNFQKHSCQSRVLHPPSHHTPSAWRMCSRSPKGPQTSAGSEKRRSQYLQGWQFFVRWSSWNIQ